MFQLARREIFAVACAVLFSGCDAMLEATSHSFPFTREHGSVTPGVDAASHADGGWRFDCSATGWSRPESLATDIGAWDLAFNSHGAVHVVYTHQCALWGKHNAAGKWSCRVPLTQGSACPDAPKVALNADGEALAVWKAPGTGADGGVASERIWSERYAATDVFPVPTSPVTMPFGNVDAYDSAAYIAAPIGASLDEAGRSVAAFALTSQRTFERSVYGASATEENVWSLNQLETNTTVWLGFAASAARQGSDNVLLAGCTVGNHGVSGQAIWGYHFQSPNQTWIKELEPEPDPAMTCRDVRLAAAPDGSWGLALWQSYMSPSSNMLSARTYPWSAAKETVLGYTVRSFNVAVNSAGDAVAVAISDHGVQAIDRSNGTWATAPVALDSTAASGSLASAPAVALDEEGNAFAIWARDTNPGIGVWGAFRPVGSDWRAAQLIGPSDLGAVASTRLVVIGDGEVMAVWSQVGTSTTELWSARFTLGE